MEGRNRIMKIGLYLFITLTFVAYAFACVYGNDINTWFAGT